MRNMPLKMDLKQFLTKDRVNSFKKSIFFYVVFLCNATFAQVFFGVNGLGRLELVNDSIYTVSFIIDSGEPIVNSGVYYVNGDTVFISSNIPIPYHICVLDEDTMITGNCTLVKVYRKIGNSFSLIEGCYGVFETANKKLFIKNVFLKSEDIIVFKDGPFYKRLKIKNDLDYSKMLVIDFLNLGNGFEEVLTFNRFPLLVKGKKLIPCGSDEVIEDCWIYNGFYFPKMKRRKKDIKYQTLGLWSLGIRGLPYFEIP